MGRPFAQERMVLWLAALPGLWLGIGMRYWATLWRAFIHNHPLPLRTHPSSGPSPLYVVRWHAVNPRPLSLIVATPPGLHQKLPWPIMTHWPRLAALTHCLEHLGTVLCQPSSPITAWDWEACVTPLLPLLLGPAPPQGSGSSLLGSNLSRHTSIPTGALVRGFHRSGNPGLPCGVIKWQKFA